MEEVATAARRIERILSNQSNSKLEQLIISMQDQIRILTKDLKSAHEQMASPSAPATPTADLAASPATTVAAAQPPPIAQPSPMAIAQPPPAAQLPPIATAQPPPYPPARPLYQDYGEEGPYHRPPRRKQERKPPRCFLRNEEGHFAYRCPARLSCRACCASKPENLLSAHLEAKFSSFPRQTVVKAPPRGI